MRQLTQQAKSPRSLMSSRRPSTRYVLLSALEREQREERKDRDTLRTYNIASTRTLECLLKSTNVLSTLVVEYCHTQFER